MVQVQVLGHEDGQNLDQVGRGGLVDDAGVVLELVPEGREGHGDQVQNRDIELLKGGVVVPDPIVVHRGGAEQWGPGAALEAVQRVQDALCTKGGGGGRIKRVYREGLCWCLSVE